ncbi:MAG: hypothetical protein ACO1OB_02790 [Archangium sp.]
MMLLAGCGSPSPEPEPPKPVVSTPLTGEVAGAAWSPKSAVASARRAFSDDKTERWIDLGVGDFDCSDFLPDAEIIGTLPWQTGAYSLGLQRNLTFVVQEADGGIRNKVATDGRVEFIDATGPDAGPSIVRIRARFDADNEIEGQVEISVCD